MAYQNPDGSYENEWPNPPVVVITPTTGTTYSIPNSCRHLYVKPAGAIAALTLKLPASPVQGQFVDVAFSATVTALTTQDSAGTAVTGAATAGAAGAGTVLRYVGAAWVKWR
jgi:chemotaxis response regulator CheB